MFDKIFKDWITKKSDSHVKWIDYMADETGLDPAEWFSLYLGELGHYAGDGFLISMSDSFSFFIYKKFEQLFMKYIPPRGHSMYNTPYLFDSFSVDVDLYQQKIVYENVSELATINNSLSVEQRMDLFQHKLYRYIMNETKTEIFTKKEIRQLKLKKINEVNSKNKE